MRDAGPANSVRRCSTSPIGDAGINIATFHVGRDAPGANAIALIEGLPPARRRESGRMG
jgi:hypothetical protein